MKTKIEQANKKFEPINIILTLENPEDLKNFLIFASVMSESDSYSNDIPPVEINNVDFSLDGCDIAEFVDRMITSLEWINLCNVYKNHME